jgi:hypothetical protein
MAPKFTYIDLLWFSFISFWQFILVPALAVSLFLLARRQRLNKKLMGGLLIFISPLLAIQALEFLTLLPAPFRISSTAFIHLFQAGLPVWFFFITIGVVAVLMTRPVSIAHTQLVRGTSRLVAIISLGLAFINGGVFFSGIYISHVAPEYLPAALTPNPQFYVPSAPLRGTVMVSTKFVDANRLEIQYKITENGEIITLTETPNGATSLAGCNQQDVAISSCANIGTTSTGGKIMGQPAIDNSNRHGYYSVKAALGTTLVEIYAPTNEFAMQDDFVSYFNGFKRVGKSQVQTLK